MLQNTNILLKNISIVDFILKTVPEDIKLDTTIVDRHCIFLGPNYTFWYIVSYVYVLKVIV